MTRVHTSPNAVEIHNLKNVLQAQGIECEIRGEFRKAAAGELPVSECWVELWIIDDTEEENAQRILAGPSAGRAVHLPGRPMLEPCEVA